MHIHGQAPNDRICLLFQLVAQIADFPHVHYLLAYDASIAERATQALQGASGRAYLEKIVQLAIDIPQIPRSVLYEKTNGYLLPILNRFGVGEESAEALRAREIIAHALMPSMQTMRDHKRFCNAFEFESSYLGDKISIVDLIALVSLRQFSPEVIAWIDARVSRLCGTSNNSFVPSEAAQYKDIIAKEICELIGGDRSRAESIVDTLTDMFPRFACSCGLFSEATTLEQMKMEGRVACEEVYVRYRTSSLSSWGYPREAIRTLLSEASRAEIADTLDTGLVNGFDFAEEASGLVGNLSHERACEIAGGALDSIKRSRRTDELSSHGDRLEQLLKSLLMQCGKDKAFSLLNEAVAQSTPEGLVRLSHLVNTEELMHGRLAGDTARPDRQLLSLENLRRLERIYTQRIEKVSDECNLLSLDGVGMLLYLWSNFNGDAERHYIGRSLNEDEFALVRLCNLCAGTWRSIDNHGVSVVTGWSPNRGAVERYLDVESACEAIDRIRMKPAFWDFSDQSLQATAAIYLMIGRGIPRPNEHSTIEVDQNEVLSLVGTWRDEYNLETAEGVSNKPDEEP